MKEIFFDPHHRKAPLQDEPRFSSVVEPSSCVTIALTFQKRRPVDSEFRRRLQGIYNSPQVWYRYSAKIWIGIVC